MPSKKRKRGALCVCVCAIPTISVFQILSSKFPKLVVVNPAEVGNSSITLGAAWKLFGVAAAIRLPNHRRGWRSFSGAFKACRCSEILPGFFHRSFIYDFPGIVWGVGKTLALVFWFGFLFVCK